MVCRRHTHIVRQEHGNHETYANKQKANAVRLHDDMLEMLECELYGIQNKSKRRTHMLCLQSLMTTDDDNEQVHFSVQQFYEPDFTGISNSNLFRIYKYIHYLIVLGPNNRGSRPKNKLSNELNMETNLSMCAERTAQKHSSSFLDAFA